jgi:hypothetical protein
MKINKKNKQSKSIIPLLAIGATVLLLAGSAIYVYAFNGNLFGWNKGTPVSDSTINLDKPTSEQIESGKEIKEESTNKPDSSGTNNTSTNTTISITAANQSGEIFQIRSIISALISSGTCTIALTKDGVTVTKTAGIQAQSSASTCQGFDIPTSELSVGDWAVKLSFVSGDLGGSTEKKITVK